MRQPEIRLEIHGTIKLSYICFKGFMMTSSNCTSFISPTTSSSFLLHNPFVRYIRTKWHEGSKVTVYSMYVCISVYTYMLNFYNAAGKCRWSTPAFDEYIVCLLNIWHMSDLISSTSTLNLNRTRSFTRLR